MAFFDWQQTTNNHSYNLCVMYIILLTKQRGGGYNSCTLNYV